MPTVTTETVCCKVKSLKVLAYFFLIVPKLQSYKNNKNKRSILWLKYQNIKLRDNNRLCTQPLIFPRLTVSALLLRQRRRAGGDVGVFAGYVLGDEHAPVGLGHGRDGREEGERRRGVALLLRQVVVLRGKAFVEHAGAHVGEGRGLRAASLLLREGGGCADAQRLQGVGLVGLRRPVLGLLPLLGKGSAEAGVRGMLSGNRGRGLAERLGQRAEASSHGDGRQVVPD